MEIAQDPLNPALRRLAMLIDGENSQAKMLDKMLEEASKHGTVTIRRIYGDWTSQSMFQWCEVANKYAFQTPHQISYTTGKNAIDTFLIIDAMDLLHSGNVNGFCIISSDSDFTGLAKRIREQGVFVMGMGRSTTPESFKRACEIFTHVELFSDSSENMSTSEHSKDSNQITTDAKQDGLQHDKLPDWKGIVSKAVDMTAQDEWASLAAVGSSIMKIDSSFDTRLYGSKKLLLLIETAPDIFEIRKDERGSNPPVYYVKRMAD